MSSVKNLRKRNALQRKPIVATIIGLLLAALTLLGAGVSNAATPEQNIIEALRSGGDLSKIAAMVMPKATPVSAVVAGIKPTPAALATRGPATYYVEGTGGGKNAGVVQTDKGAYVMSPYPASIFNGPVMGPYSFGDSVEIGAQQAIANAKANPQPVNYYDGHSQGQASAWQAAAKDGQASHIRGTGTPINPGTGFVNVMPKNLFITDIGDAMDLQPGDRADLFNQSGDCWGNMPSLLTPQSWPACIRSTVDTHYNENGGYGQFREDTVYESSPGVFQHVQWTENGYVLWAQDLGIQLTEQQKQQIRDFAPQGRPGIQNGPTLREIFDPVGMVQKAVEGTLTQVPAAVHSDAPVAPANPVAAIAEAAAPLMEQAAPIIDNLVAQAPPELQKIAEPILDQWTAPAPSEPVYTAPTADWSAPVTDWVDNGIQALENLANNVQTPAVGNVAAPAAPAMPDLGAAMNDLNAGISNFLQGVR